MGSVSRPLLRKHGPLVLVFTGSVFVAAVFAAGCQGSGATLVEVGSQAPPATTDAAAPGDGPSQTKPDGGSSTRTDAGGTTGEDSGTGTTDAGGTTGGDSGTGADAGGDTGMSSDSGWGAPVTGGPTGTGAAATVTVNPSVTLGTVGPGFAGFSYEKTHITNDSLTSTNAALVALYKLVGSPVMRLGANDVDHCNWSGAGPAPAAPSGQPFTFNVVTGMVDELCSFLTATGAKIIYGVNFESDNVTQVGAESAYVQGKCGSNVIGIELGNEINAFGSWTSLKSEWETLASAIVATPGALLIGPAASPGNAQSFSTPFAAAESAKFGDKLVLLTQHFYTASAGTSDATVGRLETPFSDTTPDGLLGMDTTMNTAAVNNKIPGGYRLGETNTFSHHGQMGLSDTLISALWAIDEMFVTAEHGGGGANYHGGETGMDGTSPFYYEPIMEKDGVVVQVQPLYYGMLLLYLAGQGSVLSTTVATSSTYFTAYALQGEAWTSVVLDNKDTTGVSATVNLGTGVKSASAIYLLGTPAGSLTAAATDVTLASAQVTADGAWNRRPPYIQATSGDTVSVYVPPASAVLVRALE